MSRLIGLETEYAIRFTPTPGYPRPGNDEVYDAIQRAVGALVTTRSAGGLVPSVRRRVFMENGGSLSYEHLPWAEDGGLVEGATPECRSASQLLCYQRAQERLLVHALPAATSLLEDAGFPGQLGLIKNCRDVDGQIYGAQENYEVVVARGPHRVAYLTGLSLLAPLVLIYGLLQWGVVFAYLVLWGLPGAFIRKGPFDDAWARDVRMLERIVRVMYWPVTYGFLLLMRKTAFTKVRGAATGFMVSRAVISGAGTVSPDGSFGLSEKGPAIGALCRTTVDNDQRSIFDTGNLVKAVPQAGLEPSLSSYRRLFRRSQRMQLGLSDSNMADVAEALKIGTTALVVDMADAGWLDDAPVLDDPVAGLKAVCADPTLRAEVATDRGPMTALDLQRYYLERAEAWVAQGTTIPLATHRLVVLWRQAIEGLATDPAGWIGRIDWVTKRFLLEECGTDATHPVRKRLDIGYHELGRGYFERLKDLLECPELVDPEEIERAMRSPPTGSPATLRGELVRRYADAAYVSIDWHQVRVGGPLRRKVLRLDDYRD